MLNFFARFSRTSFNLGTVGSPGDDESLKCCDEDVDVEKSLDLEIDAQRVYNHFKSKLTPQSV